MRNYADVACSVHFTTAFISAEKRKCDKSTLSWNPNTAVNKQPTLSQPNSQTTNQTVSQTSHERGKQSNRQSHMNNFSTNQATNVLVKLLSSKCHRKIYTHIYVYTYLCGTMVTFTRIPQSVCFIKQTLRIETEQRMGGEEELKIGHEKAAMRID